MAREALIIVIKRPEAGQVKTRLAKTMGHEKALAIYRRLMAHTRRVAMQLPVDLLLYYSPSIDTEDDWPSPPFHKRLQCRGDIGARMHHALAEALHDHDKAVLIGSDIATLQPDLLREAFEALERHDCVIGPARDGGYYLIGLKQAQPELFSNMTWSTDRVFRQTRKRLESLDQSYFVLPTQADIDTEEDWIAYGRFLDEPRQGKD